jgi:hypothetical protein
MHNAVDGRHSLVVKCLIKDGGADIDAMITVGIWKYTVLQAAAMNSNYVLAQWLIEEGALIPTGIWNYLGTTCHLERADAAELSSFLKVLLLLPLSPEHDHYLPEFVAKLSPQHAELCKRGRQLRDRLPAYLEQQKTSVGTDCPLPTVLQEMVTAYARPTPKDLWSDLAEWL